MRPTSLTIAIVALLAVNAVVYAYNGRGSEGLDALAWFALLLLFTVETSCPRWARMPRNAVALDLMRLIAAAAILWAAIAYVREGEWLDALNAWLWIGVVAVLELEMRATTWAMRHQRLVIAISALLYAALATVATTWLVQGEWFDAYDAALWIAAFVLLEMDWLRHSSGNPSTPEKII